jgi:hypothetical protein
VKSQSGNGGKGENKKFRKIKILRVVGSLAYLFRGRRLKNF